LKQQCLQVTNGVLVDINAITFLPPSNFIVTLVIQEEQHKHFHAGIKHCWQVHKRQQKTHQEMR